MFDLKLYKIAIKILTGIFIPSTLSISSSLAFLYVNALFIKGTCQMTALLAESLRTVDMSTFFKSSDTYEIKRIGNKY